MYKKQVIVFLFCVMVGELLGCTTVEPQTDKEESSSIQMYLPLIGCYGNDGILYEEKIGVLQFIDYVSGQNIILCSKPNCTHEAYSGYNTDPFCEATLPSDKQHQTVIYKGYLYTFMTDFEKTEIFYKQVYAEKWEKLIEIPYSYLPGMKMLLQEGKLYYTGAVMQQKEDAIGLTTIPMLIEVGLEDKEYRVLEKAANENNNYFVSGIEGDFLYYIISTKNENNEEKISLYKISLLTKESVYLAEMDEAHWYVGVQKGIIYTMGTAGLCSLETDEKWKLLKEVPSDGDMRAYLIENGILVFSYEHNKRNWFFYNFENKTWEEKKDMPDSCIPIEITKNYILLRQQDNQIAMIDLEKYLSGNIKIITTFKAE